LKKIIRSVFVLLYIGAVIISCVILVKPQASIFYLKYTIESQLITQDAETVYHYKLAVNPTLIRPPGILLLEDGQRLALAGKEIVIGYGGGTYTLNIERQGSVDIYFTASDNSDPRLNGKTYRLYIPMSFISRPLGVISLAILLPLTVWFLFFALAEHDRREIITHSPLGIFKLVDLFIDRIHERFGTYLNWLRGEIKTRALFWKRLFTITTCVAFLYIFMEWLFFVTMPSFMSLMSLFKKGEIFLISGWIFAVFCLLILAAFILIDLLAIIGRLSGLTRYLGLAIPSIILSALALLLIDNFTYTIFKFGISTATGIFRGVYALLFVALTGYIYFRIMKIFRSRQAQASQSKKMNTWFYASLAMLVITTGLTLSNLKYNNLFQDDKPTATQAASSLPNIILLGSDGLNAENLSVYGYHRDTTPRLKELAQSSLVAENAFTNAANTAGSVISIMTSKLPTQTRVLYPPDILTGLNSFQHMPGILNNLGYETVELGVPFYIDANIYNLQDGFDIVNNRTVNMGEIGAIGQRIGFESETYFLTRLTWRISDRILHIFFIREMQNPFDIVTQPVPEINDQTKINQALALFDQYPAPIFIHIHLLGTHGGYYSPSRRFYSAGEAQIAPWMTDFYDDTLRDFDSYVGEFIDRLKAKGQYDNTLLIIYTDHNKEFKVDERIPLIMHFPGGKDAGEITMNVQNMDIAPTVLDYLGIAQPVWMDGESLLDGGPTEPRLIFSTGTTKYKPNEQDINTLDPTQNKPPFFQFSFINILDCQKMVSFDLTTYEWTSINVSGYVDPCKPQDLLSADQIKQAVYQRLDQDGFDISSLPKIMP
jgi:glucan phosphoethanolaminetransferase (alkaline phosphatase superfamily)